MQQVLTKKQRLCLKVAIVGAALMVSQLICAQFAGTDESSPLYIWSHLWQVYMVGAAMVILGFAIGLYEQGKQAQGAGVDNLEYYNWPPTRVRGYEPMPLFYAHAGIHGWVPPSAFSGFGHPGGVISGETLIYDGPQHADDVEVIVDLEEVKGRARLDNVVRPRTGKLCYKIV